MRTTIAELSHSNTIRGIEIFSSGTHNGDTYTDADLDDIVSAYKDLDYKPAIKVGHTKDQPGAPAYGWVENLRREGPKLVADFTSMHDSVLDAIRKRSYDRVSSEIYFNFKRGAKTFRRALKAVALLGSEVPAVANLTPLHKVQFAADGFDKVAQASEAPLTVSTDSLVEALSGRVEGLINLVKEFDMKTVAQVKEEITRLNAELATLRAAADDKKDNTKIAELSQKLGGLEGELRILEQVTADNEKRDRENAALRATVAKLSEKDRERDVKERVSVLTVPAFKPYFEALFTHAAANPDAKLKVYTTAEGKTTEKEMGLADVGTALIEEINAKAAKLFTADHDAGGRRTRKEAPAGEKPGEELDKLANEYLVKHPELKGDYAAAFEQVCKENPTLAKSYEDSQNPRGH